MNPIEGGAAATTIALIAGTVILIWRYPHSPWASLSPWGVAWGVLLLLATNVQIEARRGNPVAGASTADLRRPGGRRFLLMMSILLTPLLVVVSLPIALDVWRARRSRQDESR